MLAFQAGEHNLNRLAECTENAADALLTCLCFVVVKVDGQGKPTWRERKGKQATATC